MSNLFYCTRTQHNAPNTLLYCILHHTSQFSRLQHIWRHCDMIPHVSLPIRYHDISTGMPWGRAQNTEGLRLNDVINRLIWAVKRSWCATCLIEPVILPDLAMHQFQMQLLNASTMPLIMSVYHLGNQFQMNLSVMKLCVVMKGSKWLKNTVSLLEN